MQTIAESDAVKRFATLLDTIEQGEEVTVTRKGKPVARIVPIRKVGKTQEEAELEELEAELERLKAERQRKSIRDAADELLMLGCELRLDGLTIRDLIDDGRR